jgi:hypothetical protein
VHWVPACRPHTVLAQEKRRPGSPGLAVTVCAFSRFLFIISSRPVTADLRRLVPEPVEDTGSLAAWLEPHVEDFSSTLGRQILRDMVADDAATLGYFGILKEHL